jgi:N6-L-threonylcarbamoyladenine synthase
MKILGVETSCDETSAAVIENGKILSTIISSQEIHSNFGGVVPELASRAHIRLIVPIVEKALRSAGVSLNQLNGLAVTCGPGLVGALLVGLNFIKGLSASLNIPYIGVNHIEGHIYGNLLSQKEIEFPIVFLIVSGGHTQIVLMEDHLKYQILGKTRDDAVGEALDKGAKMLGLGYPGGPVIDKLAKTGDPNYIKFPRAWLKGNNFDFSYSGLKTALLTWINAQQPNDITENIHHICASYQAAAVEVLVKKTIMAAQQYKVKTVAIAGGVAANSLLRASLLDDAKTNKMNVFLPENIYCTDNAAMIARVGEAYLNTGYTSPFSLNAFPSLKLKSAS